MDARKQILSDVAAGLLSPEEAAARLERLDQAPPVAEPGAPARRVRILSTVGVTEVIGDRSVREAVAEGPHAVRSEADAFVIESEPPEDGASWVFARREHRPERLLRHHAWRLPTRLKVRMNPDLPLEVDLGAGTLSIRDVKGPIRARASAGTARIEGFVHPVDIAVLSGTVRASGVLCEGESRVRCEAGTVRIHLERGSSVRIRAHAAMGKVLLPHAESRPSRRWLVGGSEQDTVGDGAGLLDVEASMGTVYVSADT